MDDNVVVLLYPNNGDFDEVHRIGLAVKQTLGVDKTVLCIPKDYDLLLSCSTEELWMLKQVIETALESKMVDEDGLCSDLPRM